MSTEELDTTVCKECGASTDGGYFFKLSYNARRLWLCDECYERMSFRNHQWTAGWAQPMSGGGSRHVIRKEYRNN